MHKKYLWNDAENEVPLAAAPIANPVENEQQNMSWWWLLIVALLGGTGVAMYEKHKKNQEAKVENKTDK